MRHMRPLNQKAARIDNFVAGRLADVVALQDRPPARPHVPMGCFMSCYWPAAVPDHLNNAPDWAAKCAAATKDWQNLDIVFP